MAAGPSSQLSMVTIDDVQTVHQVQLTTQDWEFVPESYASAGAGHCKPWGIHYCVENLTGTKMILIVNDSSNDPTIKIYHANQAVQSHIVNDPYGGTLLHKWTTSSKSTW